MYYILVAVGGAIIGYFVATVVEGGKRKEGGYSSREGSYKRKENLEQLRKFAVNSKEFTNADVETELGVSDATATRYCDELEQEGSIIQIGKTGQSVKYQVKK